MKIKRVIVSTAIVIVAGIQFIPATNNNIKTVEEKDFNVIYETPTDIKTMLIQNCYDCHSNSTNYPWYSKIQPFRMIMDNHVKEGKNELNLSSFGEYSNRKRRNRIESIINEIEADKMPLSSYKLMHFEAKLSLQEKNDLLGFESIKKCGVFMLQF